MILDKPVITEKSLTGTAEGKYVFKVSPKANKPLIAKEVEDLYKVEVTAVNIVKMQPHKRYVKGRQIVSQKGWKKAVVTLKKGQKIEGFEIKG